MTVWYVQKLYHDDGCQYDVLPYDLWQTVKITMKMENGIKQTIKFLMNSRLREKSAMLFCEKKNHLLINN